LYRLLIKGCAIAALASCATTDYSEETPTRADISIFDTAIASFDTAKTAAKACHIVPAKGPARHQCTGEAALYDRTACLAFDAAIQPALEPLRYCAETQISSEDDALANQCRAYMARLMDPCLGVHALRLAYADRALSQAYREAKQSGMSHDEALQSAAPNLTRYRD
jgi:hypothetical protein